MNVFSRDYIDRLFEEYKLDPRSVPMEWQSFFANMEADCPPSNSNQSQAHSPAIANHSSGTVSDSDHGRVIQLQDRVDQLIRGFRVRGHLEAKIDPLGLSLIHI